MEDCCCLTSWWWVIFTGLITIAGFFLSRKDPPKIAGVYSQPGKFYWLKVVTFYLLIRFRKWKDSRDEQKVRDHTKAETYDAGYGSKSKSSPEEMDKVQPLSDHFQAIDTVYFNGANSKGFSIVSGTSRRAHKVLNGFMIFRIPEVGTLVSPKFPDTMLFDSSDEFFGAEGFRFEPVVPMKHWKLSYEGNLKNYEDETKVYKINLKADWKTNLAYFDYDFMIPPWTLARAIAREPWSRQYFEQMKSGHITHHEQHGNLVGEIEVDGTKYKFSMPSMRDHSYGVKRDWKLLHRYMIHMFQLEDGRRFDIGNVCQPVTSTQLEIGYMYEADGSLHALEWVDLQLYNQGEQGSPPTDYGIRIKATNGKEYYVQIQVLETQELFMGWEFEAKIIERRCKFTVDGIEGYGISECQYRNTGGRPEKYSKSDPDWVKTVKTV